MSNKSRYIPSPQQPAPISQELNDKITMKMIESFMGMNSKDDEAPERPKTCGDCGYCHSTDLYGVRCFAHPPKVVVYVPDSADATPAPSPDELRPKVDLGDPGCSEGVRR